MDEMPMDMPQPGPGQYGSDRELFRRVWERVMPEGAQSPIRLEPPPVSGPGLMPMPEMERPPVDCLGEDPGADLTQLEELAQQMVRNGRAYQNLARRAGGAASRVLAGMAADERRAAKRLAAAYFLITGRRWQGIPTEGEGQEREPMHLLRHQYMTEQRSAAAAQSAAQQTDDMCLRQIYEELAREEQGHARAIRGLLEQM